MTTCESLHLFENYKYHLHKQIPKGMVAGLVSLFLNLTAKPQMHPLEFPQKILFYNTSEAPLGWLLPWVLRGAQFTCGNPRGEATELRIKQTKKNHFLSSDGANRDGWWVTSRSCCLRASRKGSLKGFSPVESTLFFKKIFFVLFSHFCISDVVYRCNG